MNDLRFAFRQLSKRPGFTVVAVLTLTLGISANTAVFSLVDAFLIRPLVGERSGQLIQCYSKDTKRPDTYRFFSYPNYQYLREHATAFSGLLAYGTRLMGLAGGDVARHVQAFFVSANYFSTLGVRMAQGRGFVAEEEKPGGDIPVVVGSHLYWEKAGADPELVGLGAGSAHGGGGRPDAEKHDLPGQGHRPGYVLPGATVPGGGSSARLLCAGAPRCEDQADGGAAIRVTVTRSAECGTRHGKQQTTNH